MQVFLPYARTVSILKWLTLSLFAYFATVLVVDVDWRQVARDLITPDIKLDRDYLTTVVAVLGTTISPYLFFWQAAEEAEDVRVYPQRKNLLHGPEQAQTALARIRTDTLIGMGFSNLVALAIVITTAATLHAHGLTTVQTSAEAAEALRPIAGSFAFTVFALGIIGTGLLAVPVLAGSAAYAVGEAFHWHTGLSRQPSKARAFYTTLALATALGMALSFAPINPMSALFWAAVVNGVIAVPIMIVMMLAASNKEIMGDYAITGTLRIAGWLSTAVMTVASLAMFAMML
jgi:Mn2+/Fe2+ NRAMP family transporter